MEDSCFAHPGIDMSGFTSKPFSLAVLAFSPSGQAPAVESLSDIRGGRASAGYWPVKRREFITLRGGAAVWPPAAGRCRIAAEMFSKLGSRAKVDSRLVCMLRNCAVSYSLLPGREDNRKWIL
jgi:hypothetical protein